MKGLNMWLLIVVFTAGVYATPLQIGPFMDYTQCSKLRDNIEIAFATTALGVDAKCVNMQPR